MIEPLPSTVWRRRVASALALALACGVSAARVDARRPSPTPSPAPTATPTVAPLPTPPSFAIRMAHLSDQLAAIAHATPGSLGIAVADPSTNTHVAVHGDTSYALANTTAFAIALAAYRLVDKRVLNLDAVLRVQPGDVRSNGPLARAYPQGGVTLPLWKLMRAMLADDDPTASDLLLHTVGGPNVVGSALVGVGLAGFSIRTSEFERERGGAPNAGTPDGMAALLTGIAKRKYLSLDQSTDMLTLLAHATNGGMRLRAGFPASVRFAHLSGTIAGSVNEITSDAGLLTLPDGRLIAVVAFLDAPSGDDAKRDAVLANVGKAVYAAFVP